MQNSQKDYIGFDINARYGLTRSIELIDKDKGIFRVWGKSLYCRGAEGMFDFEGGPMFMLGEDFYGFGTISAIGIKNPDDPEFVPAESVAVVYISVDYSKKGLKMIEGKRSAVTPKEGSD